VGGELVLLPFQRHPALAEAALLLGQPGLLGDDRAGLNAERVAFARRPSEGLRDGPLPLGERGTVRVGQPDDELKGAYRQEVAVGKGAVRDGPVVDEGGAAGEGAEEKPGGGEDEGAVERLDAFDVQANVTALGAADDGDGVVKGPVRPAEAAVVDD
jgi:hypothetical protein